MVSFLIVDSSLMYASHGNQIGLVNLVQGYRLKTSSANGHYLSTKSEGKKSIKLKRNEIVLQVSFMIFCHYLLFFHTLISECLRGYLHMTIRLQLLNLMLHGLIY